MVAWAESGDITGMAGIVTNADESITTVMLTNGNHFAVSHGISTLWYSFQRRMADSAYERPETPESD